MATVKQPLQAIWFTINQQCNLECAHCLTNSGPRVKAPILKLADIQRIAKDAHAMGVERFYVTGGEPTLHPEFFEIVAFLQSLGEVIFFTNGTLFNEEMLERLEATADKDRLEVRVSWTEYHAASYQDMLPGDPDMRLPLQTLKALRARGFTTSLVSMDGTGDKNLGLFPTLRGKKVTKEMPPVGEWFAGCDGSNSLSIWMDGRVYLCPPLTLVAPHKLGDIHTDSLDELLERRPDLVSTPQCTVCCLNEP
ncbi:MAG: radical SAM protein [Candidatus Tectimicrobiota bacterium]